MRLHDEPSRDWKNIFQLWKENGERLPFIVARNSWDAASGSYLVVERIEIKNGPTVPPGALALPRQEAERTAGEDQGRRHLCLDASYAGRSCIPQGVIASSAST